jgi:3-deoxy-D-manno-octulosonic acid kinase
MFDAAHWPERRVSDDSRGGRGAVLFVSHAGSDWVIRHYYRGGLIGRLLRDRYLWNGAHYTRAFREWQLLADMHAAGLPVPAPVAARYERHGAWYTADLITLQLPDVEGLAARMVAGTTATAEWRAVGACIAGFHAQGYCHADLNATNIQIAADGCVYLLDWDRGARRSGNGWQQGNLDRLLRSCRKLRDTQSAGFDAADWQALLAGYNAG